MRYLTCFLALVALAFAAESAPKPAPTPEPSATPIRLNTVGYLPDALKQASVPATNVLDFTIVRSADASVAFSGHSRPPRANIDTAETLVEVDFSALQEPGRYRVRIAGLGDSPEFTIGADVYRDPFVLVTRAMYLWRCGVAVDGDWQGQHFHHDACHLDDAWLDHVTGQHEKRPSIGGWHDAGDYNKYIVNAGITVGSMLRAWEEFPAIRSIGLSLPESGGVLPDYLAEIKFELDWALTMQNPDGSVLTKVSTEGFGGFIQPEDEKTPRYFCGVGTTTTASFTAMFAQAARAFRPYDAAYADRCLTAARLSQAWLTAHPAQIDPDQSKFHTGNYNSPDADDRLWAVAELWETTGEPALLADLEQRIRTLGTNFDAAFDWPIVKNLGLFTYLLSSRPGREPALVAAVAQNLYVAADLIVAKARAHGYARVLGEQYSWGANGCIAREAHLLQVAYRRSKNPVYRYVALDALNHLFGRNVHGRSYVTGLGFEPPAHVHDRRQSGAGIDHAWPGYLVGGPNPTARDWFDLLASYRTNEIAINWNGALIYALAAFVDAP